MTVSGINPGNGLVDIIEIEYGTEGIAYILPSVSEKKIEFLQQSTSYPVKVYAVVYAGGLSQRSDVREKSTFTQTGKHNPLTLYQNPSNMRRNVNSLTEFNILFQ